MFQQITLVGNLGADPEMRYTPSGAAVTNLSVATNKKYQTADGENREQTIWFRVSVWNKQAESAAKYLEKGSRVLVVGELQEPRVWEDRKGEPRASLEVRALNVRFLSTPDVRQEVDLPGSESDIPF